jgi:hypothetical protein
MTNAHDICNDILWAIDQATTHTHDARQWDNPEYGDAFRQFIAPMLASVTVRVRELEARIREVEDAAEAQKALAELEAAPFFHHAPFFHQREHQSSGA